LPLIKLSSEHTPTEFGYIIVESVVFKAGDHIRPGARVLLINTKIGKFWVVSHLKCRISGRLPHVGESLDLDGGTFLTVVVQSVNQTIDRVTFEEAIGSVETLVQNIEFERKKLITLWRYEEELELLQRQGVEEGSNEEPAAENTDAFTEENDEVEAVNEKQSLSRYLGQILFMIVTGGTVGLISTRFFGDANTPIWIFGAFMLGLFCCLWASSTFYSDVPAAVIFALVFFMAPQASDLNKLTLTIFPIENPAITEAKMRAAEIVQQKDLDAKKERTEKIALWDKRLMPAAMTRRVIKTLNSRWSEKADRKDHWNLMFDVVNGSNGQLMTLEVDPFKSGNWRKITFKPPLLPGEMRTKTILIGRADDGKPAETMGKPDKERWMQWQNSFQNAALKPYDRKDEFLKEARTWIFAK